MASRFSAVFALTFGAFMAVAARAQDHPALEQGSLGATQVIARNGDGGDDRPTRSPYADLTRPHAGAKDHLWTQKYFLERVTKDLHSPDRQGRALEEIARAPADTAVLALPLITAGVESGRLRGPRETPTLCRALINCGNDATPTLLLLLKDATKRIRGNNVSRKEMKREPKVPGIYDPALQEVASICDALGRIGSNSPEAMSALRAGAKNPRWAVQARRALAMIDAVQKGRDPKAIPQPWPIIGRGS